MPVELRVMLLGYLEFENELRGHEYQQILLFAVLFWLGLLREQQLTESFGKNGF